MSEATVIVDRVKAHPLWLVGGVLLVIVFIMTRNRNTTAATPVTATVSTGIDPTAAALQATQMQDNTQIAAAQINAQSVENALQAQTAMTINTNQTNLAVATVNANVANAQTAASIFGEAVTGLTLNSGDGAGGTSSNGLLTTSGVANNTQIVPGGPGWQSWMAQYAHSNYDVPIVNGSSGGLPTNVTNNQIEELFNNVIRAGTGTAPIQTVTMQMPGTTGVDGVAHIDPVFATFGSNNSAPVITDITLDPSSAYGYTGSVYNPASGGAATIITPGGASGNGTGTVVGGTTTLATVKPLNPNDILV